LENKSIKLRFVLLIPLLILIIGWLGYFWSRTSGYGKRGEISSQFSRDLLEVRTRIKKNARILVIDMDKDDFLSLTNCVAYGFNSMLKLYMPEKKAGGAIITPSQLSEIKIDLNILRFFLYQKRNLIGPLKGYELRNLLVSFSPQHIKPTNITPKIRPIKKKKKSKKGFNEESTPM
jgi:hypothetical protein